MHVRPFVKWAGGKAQILPDIRRKYPAGLGTTITRYCEPFIGGGAVFFDLLSKYQFCNILINDINPELINSYIQIKKNVTLLISSLQSLQTIFLSNTTEKRKELYYEKRERFNKLKINKNIDNNIEKAALFIFLNKTCFNGLFRVNSRGFYNVPVGAYKNPVICDSENLKNMSLLLKNTNITCGDYRNCLSFIDNKTFVYIDPPYRPITKTSNFTSYSEIPFDDTEQVALGQFIHHLHGKGAKIVASNSDPKNIDSTDNFFDDLYNPYSIARIPAKRMINSNGNSRGSINELLITNF